MLFKTAVIFQFILLIPVIRSVDIKVGLIINSDSAYKAAYGKIAALSAERAGEPISDVKIVLIEEIFNDSLMINSGDAACELIEQGVVAVISTTDSTSTKTEAEILARLHIPMISVSASDPFLHNPVGTNYTLTMSPSDTEQSKAIFAIIKRYGWFEFSILASSDRYGINGVLGLLNLQYLVNTDDRFRINQAQYFHPGEDEIRKRLNVIRDSLEHIIVLHCSARDAKMVLAQANEMRLLGVGYVWIVTDAIVGDALVLSSGNNDIFPSYLEGLIGTVPAYDQGTTQYKAFKDNYSGFFADITAYTLKTYDAVQIIQKAAVNYRKANNKQLTQSVSCKSPTIHWQQGADFYSELSNVRHDGVSIKVRFENGKMQNNTFDIVNFMNNGFQKVGKWNEDEGILGMGDKVIFLGSNDVVPPAYINKLSGIL